MGSVWHALAYGFGGLRPSSDALVIDPHLPETWSQLEIRVQFRGVPVRLQFEPKLIVVNVPTPTVVIVNGNRVTCAAGETRLPTA